MNIFYSLLYFISSLICSLLADERIIGGSPAGIDSAPYQVSLQNVRGSHVCGGAIISKNAIISAAHCFVGAEPENIFVVVGTIDLNKKKYSYNASDIITHFGYDNETKEHDIALLLTSKEIEFTEFIKPISVSSRFIKSGEILSFTGFGVTNMTESDKSSESLQVIQLTAFEMETCRYAYRNIRLLFDSQICTFTVKGQGICYGDSGGPLVFDHTLVGLSSFGVPCGVGFPDVYTRTSSYLPWILVHVPDVDISRASYLDSLKIFTIILCMISIINNHFMYY